MFKHSASLVWGECPCNQDGSANYHYFSGEQFENTGIISWVLIMFQAMCYPSKNFISFYQEP